MKLGHAGSHHLICRIACPAGDACLQRFRALSFHDGCHAPECRQGHILATFFGNHPFNCLSQTPLTTSLRDPSSMIPPVATSCLTSSLSDHPLRSSCHDLFFKRLWSEVFVMTVWCQLVSPAGDGDELRRKMCEHSRWLEVPVNGLRFALVATLSENQHSRNMSAIGWHNHFLFLPKSDDHQNGSNMGETREVGHFIT